MLAPTLMLSPWQVSDLPVHLARIEINPLSGDWEWTGPVDADGYGKVGGRGAHRVIWEFLVGPVKPGLVLDHREDWGCLTKACCWPAHLLPVTNRVNATREGSRSLARINMLKTACSTCSAPYGAANTYVYPDGRRDCRSCRAAARERYAERHAIAAAQDRGYLFGLPRAA